MVYEGHDNANEIGEVWTNEGHHLWQVWKWCWWFCDLEVLFEVWNGIQLVEYCGEVVLILPWIGWEGGVAA